MGLMLSFYKFSPKNQDRYHIHFVFCCCHDWQFGGQRIGIIIMFSNFSMIQQVCMAAQTDMVDDELLHCKKLLILKLCTNILFKHHIG